LHSADAKDITIVRINPKIGLRTNGRDNFGDPVEMWFILPIGSIKISKT